MKKIVLYAIGRDRPGIVSAVTEVLYQHNCNIEDSSMTILEGEFAIIMIVSLPEEVDLNKFRQSFHYLEKTLELYIAIKEFEKPPEILPELYKEKIYIISVLGADQPGIVHKVTKLLADYGINITDLNTKLIGKEGGKNVYAMVIEVALPEKIKAEEFANKLNELGKKLNVDIKFKPIDTLKL